MKKIFTKFKNLTLLFIVYYVFGSTLFAANLKDINYGFLKRLSYNVNLIGVVSNGNNALPNGSIIAYKTNHNRIGVMEISQSGENLVINWITYNSENSIESQGTGLSIPKLNFIDLDKGTTSATVSKENDFRWVVTSVNRNITPMFGTSFILSSSECRSSLGFIELHGSKLLSESEIQKYSLVNQNIDGSNSNFNKLKPGTKVLYKTNQGRYGVLEVVQSEAINGEVAFKFNWVTYDKGNGLIYSIGCYYGIAPTFTVDLDLGKSGTSQTADLHWAKETNIIYTLKPLNNVTLCILPTPLCEEKLNSLQKISLPFIKSYLLTGNTIDASDNANNRIPVGQKVVYLTSDGRYGIFIVDQYGEDLYISRMTYDANGNPFTFSCSELVGGFFYHDLDKGYYSTSSANSDFKYDIKNSKERYLVPQNGAKFFVIDQVTGIYEDQEQSSSSIIPNPAKDYIIIREATPNTTIYLYDNLGRSKPLNLDANNKADLNTIEPGLYQLQYQTGNDWVSRKLKVE